MHRLPLALWFCLLLCFVATPAMAHGDEGVPDEPLVRILLADSVASARVGMQGASARVLDGGSGKVLDTIKPGQELSAKAAGERVASGKHHASFLQLVPTSPEGFVVVGGNPYRGTIEIHPWNGKLLVVNHCRLDEYLYGVVPGEMPTGWHPEALKAQAVAARTYAVKQMGQYDCPLYDVKPTVVDQVYLGVKVERARSNEAIDATSGLIMTFGGQPITAYFHSSSGDSTLNGSALRGPKTGHPYLRGVPSREGAVVRWTYSMTVSELASLLRAKGNKIGDITAIGDNPFDSGLLMIAHTDGVLDLPRNYLRGFIKSDQFRSPNFMLELKPAPKNDGAPIPGKTVIHFIGTGWGHGVGMSQFGARAYAEEGWDYRRILTHYYSGTELSMWFDISGGHQDVFDLGTW